MNTEEKYKKVLEMVAFLMDLHRGDDEKSVITHNTLVSVDSIVSDLMYTDQRI